MSKYKVSIIVPVFNSESYLRETLNSLISQSVGLDVLQLILVNDGSTDGSELICAEYRDKYPDNVVLFNQENQGVSAARNAGMKVASGQYIHFMDSDDTISRNFYKESIKFLDRNRNLSFVASKIMFFDALIDPHPLNYKFKRKRIINIDTEPNNPILHVTTCVFRRDTVLDATFDHLLSVSEDVKFLSNVLLKHRVYGVLPTTTYFYRKRLDDSSAIGGKVTNIDYYTKTPKYVYGDMIDSWSTNGRIHPYIQYTLIYDLSYRLTQGAQTVLSEAAEKDYKDLIKSILYRLDNEIVESSSYLDSYTKRYIFSIKDTLYEAEPSQAIFNIDFIHISSDGAVKIEGYLEGVDGVEGVDFFVNNNKVKFVDTERRQREVLFLGDLIYSGGAVEGTFDLDGDAGGVFKAKLKRSGLPVKIKTNKFTGLSGIMWSYKSSSGFIIKNNSWTIKFSPYSKYKHLISELMFIAGILCDWRLRDFKIRLKKLLERNLSKLTVRQRVVEVLKPFLFTLESVALIPQAIILRFLCHVVNLSKSRPVWIISDRGISAGDNGEAFFRYVMSRDDRGVDVYFAISKKSKDYSRVKGIGAVLDYGSFIYKLRFLTADKIISSHADIEVTNPFLRQESKYFNLYRFDYIFLQHGVIRNDLSEWLNRFDKNITTFVTSSRVEYESIFQYPYYYPRESVVMSGLPRFDLLDNDTQNKIVVAPTYRMNLLTLKTNKLGVRGYDSRFKTSSYYRFYSKLINDPRIVKCMKDKGVVGEFYLHPNFSQQFVDFKNNEAFSVMNFPYNYRKAIQEGVLLVSDYSSLVFDFAYLRKPVVYAQFDIDTFFDNHSYSQGDFFSDEKDGFGPVCYDYESLVSSIIEYVNDNFKLSDKYKKRIDNFFEYSDKGSSERVYDEISS